MTAPSLLQLRRSTQVTLTSKGLLFVGPQQRLTMAGGETAHALWRVLEQRLLEPGLDLRELGALPDPAAVAARRIVSELVERRLVSGPLDLDIDAPSLALHEYVLDVADDPRSASQALHAVIVDIEGTDRMVTACVDRLNETGLQVGEVERTESGSAPAVERLRISWSVEAAAFPEIAAAGRCELAASAWPAFGLLSAVGPRGSSESILRRTAEGIASDAYFDVGYRVPPELMLEVMACLVVQAVTNVMIGATDYSDDQVRLVEATRLAVGVHPPPLELEQRPVRPRAPRKTEVDDLLQAATDELTGIIGAPTPYPVTQGAAAGVTAIRRRPWSPDFDTVTDKPDVTVLHLAETLETGWNRAALSDLAEQLTLRPAAAWALDRGVELAASQIANRRWYRIAAPDLDSMLAEAVAAVVVDPAVDLPDRSMRSTDGVTPTPSVFTEIRLDGEPVAAFYEWRNGCRLIGRDRADLEDLASLVGAETLEGNIAGAMTLIAKDFAYWRRLGRRLGVDSWAQAGDPALRRGGVSLGWVGVRSTTTSRRSKR